MLRLFQRMSVSIVLLTQGMTNEQFVRNFVRRYGPNDGRAL
jgi:hypothetical protein